jgi:hypothetical protein
MAIMKYRFRAIYTDGSILIENPEDPSANYSKIDRQKLKIFELFEVDTNKTVIKIDLEPKQRLIWRRRKALVPGKGEITVHIVGKQETIDGKNIQGLSLLYPDGSVNCFSRYNKKHPWLRPIKLLEIEKK